MRDSMTFVGLDYHDSQVQVCAMDSQAKVLINRSADNDWREVVQAVGRDRSVQAGIEACTGSADLAQQLADEAGWTVHLAHSRYTAKLKQSPDKSDYSDARLLADLNRVGYLPKVWLAPQKIRELRRLVTYRKGLADQQRKTKQRIGALLREHRIGAGPANRWTKAWIGWVGCLDLPEETRWIIDRELEELDSVQYRLKHAQKRMKKVTAQDPVIEQLLDEPGVGLVTAVTLRAAIGRFDRFASGKQLSRFCGLSPRNASSGQKQADAGLINESDKYLRATLIELAHRLKRYQPRWRKFADQLQQRGKAGSLIAAAVANRWVRGLYHRMQPRS